MTKPQRGARRLGSEDAAELKRAIRRSPESRYDHRLHGVWLLARGKTYVAVAEILGESTRTLTNWVHRYRTRGLAGLREERVGRPPLLNETQRAEMAKALHHRPEDAGMASSQWTGKLLQEWIDNRFAIHMSVQQCRCVLHEFRRQGISVMEPAPRRPRKPPAKDAEKLNREIRRSEEFRYAHRLHGVWLVARGMSYLAVAKILGESEKTIGNWALRYQQSGLSGLHEAKRPGRPPRLTEEQRAELAAMVREPQGPGVGPWTCKTLAVWIEDRYSIRLGQRQCRRLLQKFQGLNRA